MKTFIFYLLAFFFLQSCATQNLHSNKSDYWAKPLKPKTSNQDLSATNYTLDENDVLLREHKTNSYPTDINSPFYYINKRSKKSNALNPRPRLNNEIHRFDFYSKNRAN